MLVQMLGARKHKQDSKHREVFDPLALRRGEKEAARGVDGVAGSLALPATISSSVWHDEEEGSNERIKEEIKGKWMATNL